jgi:hypothetical protein
MNRHSRVYRALLRLYPETFRHDYGDEMARLFDEQLRDSRAASGRKAIAGLWARVIADVLATAPRQHLSREGHVPEPIIAGPATGRVLVGGDTKHGPRLVVGLLPLWVLIFFSFAAPGFMDPMYANPPSIAGLPAGVVLIAVALFLTIVGVEITRRVESEIALAFVWLLVTVPATALILFGPAAILVVLNLGT